MNVVAKNAVNLKLESTHGVRETDMTGAVQMYSEADVFVPSPEFDKHTFTPLSIYGGGERVKVLEGYGRFKVTAEGALPLHVPSFDGSYIDIMMRCSGLKRTPIYETEGDDQTPLIGYRYEQDTFASQTLSLDSMSMTEKTKGHGARFNMTLSAKMGDVVRVKFDGQAAYTGHDTGAYVIPSLAPLDAAVVDNTQKRGDLILNGNRTDIEEYEFDLGQTIVQKKTSASSGFRHDPTKMMPTVKLKGYLDEWNPYDIDAVLDGDENIISLIVKDPNDLSDPQDPTSGKVKWIITKPRCVMENAPGRSAKDGMYYLDESFRCYPNTGDDNFVVEYYL